MKTLFFLALTLVANFIFWEQELGLNWLIFVVFSIGFNYRSIRGLLTSLQGVLALAAVFISALSAVWQGTVISIAVSVVSLIVFIGIIQFPGLRTSYAAFVSSGLNFFKLPDIPIPAFAKPSEKKLLRIWKKVRLILIPLFVLFLFFILFRGGNVVFRDATDGFLDAIERFFEYLFVHLSFARIVFFCFCMALASWVVYNGRYSLLERFETKLGLRLIRRSKNVLLNPMAVRIGKAPQFRKIPTIGLKNEYKSALFMIISVTALLFVIDVIDIIYVWCGWGYTSNEVNYSTEVHEGVYLLIASILLSIALMLYVFRGNQNFYEKGKRLILWSTIWIALNGILVVSALLRNIYYISYQGLTYKRIGVFVFLVVVVCGLISLLIKIRKGKSFFYMARFNSWSILLTFVVVSSVNWDVQMCRYNLHRVRTENLDLYYLLSLSDEAILELATADSKTISEAIDNSYGLTHQSYERRMYERLLQVERRFSERPDTYWSWNGRQWRMKNRMYKVQPIQEKRFSVKSVDLLKRGE